MAGNGVGYVFMVNGVPRYAGTLTPTEFATFEVSEVMASGATARFELDANQGNNGADWTDLGWTIEWQEP